MYNVEPYTLTDAIRANVTELYFGSDADWLEESKILQQIFNDCERLKERINTLESDVNFYRKEMMRLRVEVKKLEKKVES